MAKCPKCKNKLVKSLQMLKNESFQVEVFECNDCHHKFRHTTINQLN